MLMGGIDKLDLKIPLSTKRTVWFESLYHDVLRLNSGKPSKSYARVYDLRPYGVEALLHYRCRYDHHSKLELLSVQCMSALQIRSQVQELFECDADLLKVMRLDLFADVFDFPVWWFRRNARIERKRTIEEWGPQGQLENLCSVSSLERGIETLYFGTRPTLFRIYDKGSTLRAEHARELAAAPPEVEAPTFEQRFGHAENRVRTRVEHQLVGKRVPETLRVLGALFANAMAYDPFSRLLLSPLNETPPPMTGNAAEYLQCLGLMSLVKERGRAATVSMLNRASKGNAARFIHKLDTFATSRDVQIPDLVGAYRGGVALQLVDEGDSFRVKETHKAISAEETESYSCSLY
jgi:hypothetical protein